MRKPRMSPHFTTPFVTRIQECLACVSIIFTYFNTYILLYEKTYEKFFFLFYKINEQHKRIQRNIDFFNTRLTLIKYSWFSLFSWLNNELCDCLRVCVSRSIKRSYQLCVLSVDNVIKRESWLSSGGGVDD